MSFPRFSRFTVRLIRILEKAFATRNKQNDQIKSQLDKDEGFQDLIKFICRDT